MTSTARRHGGAQADAMTHVKNGPKGITPLGARMLASNPAGWAWARYPAIRRPYDLADHLIDLGAVVADAVSRGGNVAVSMPPRHGKSETTSIATPAWVLDQVSPSAKIIVASYALEVAAGFTRVIRDHVRVASHRAEVRSDSAAAHRFDTVQGGGVYAVGVGGSLTGRGADVLIIDDPVKDAEAAQSPLQRDRAWDWYTTTARTRVEPGGAIVVVGTRWHPDDLIGRILREAETGAEDWTVVSMPAIDDSGAALWPERWPVPELDKVRQAVGAFVWSALFQQNPTGLRGDGLWEPETVRAMRDDCPSLHRLHTKHGLDRIEVAVDPSVTAHGDECGIVVGATSRIDGTTRAVLLEDVSMQAGPNEWARAAVEAYRRHEADGIVAEVNNGGELVREVIRAVDPSVPVRMVTASRGKRTRAEPIAVLSRTGRVFLAGRFPELESELQTWSPDRPGQESPNRLDAFVWLVASLLGSGSDESIDLGSHGSATAQAKASIGDELSRLYAWNPATGSAATSSRPLGGVRWA